MIVRAMHRDDIFKFGNRFYKVLKAEIMPKHVWSNSGTAFTTVTATKYEITDIEPQKNQIVHIETIGINGYIQIQLYFPEQSVRGSVKGKSEYFDWRIADFQNPLWFSVFIPQTFTPWFMIYNPKSYDITSEIWFTGYIYNIQEVGTTPPILENGNVAEYQVIDHMVPAAII